MATDVEIRGAVQNASANAIIDAASSLKRNYFLNNRWLGSHNRYARDTRNRIRVDTRSGNPKKLQLSQYIAASIILHCFDGWSYLSHAVASLLEGDVATTVHLAYYAELRASMAFLANEGIGIFDREHFWFDGSGNHHILSGDGTHIMVWRILKAWAATPTKSIRLLEFLKVGGKNFVEWLDAAGYSPGSPTASELAKDWLESWSIDLEVIERDRTLRNEASYRPQRLLSSQRQLDIISTLDKLMEFWRTCEPSISGQLGVLDLHLLRQALEKSYNAIYTVTTPGIPTAPTKKYVEFAQDTLTQIGMADRLYLKHFLSSSQSPKHTLLVEAKKKGQDQCGNMRPISVIARAILLLRLASAACNDFMQKSGIDGTDVEFWWSDIGKDIGLWESSTIYGPMTDLWADVEIALETVETWTDQNRSSTAGTRQARRDIPFDLWQLEKFQLAGLWAIGL